LTWPRLICSKYIERFEVVCKERGLLYLTYAFDDPYAPKELTRIMVYGVNGSADPLNSSLSDSTPSEIRGLLPYDIFGKAMLARYPLVIVECLE
jgi:hypothetical protein